MNADQIIRNGGSAFLTTFDVGTNYVTDSSSATALLSMRQAAKDIMYTVVNSNAYANGGNTGTPAWQIAFIAIDVLIVAGLIALEVIAIKNYKKRAAAGE